jgi:hypothetical protein
MLTTTTTENSSLIPEAEDFVERGTKQCSDIAREKTLSFNLNLNKLYLYSSVVGIVLMIFGLLLAFKYQNVLMIECLKACLIIGILNIIRLFSIS